MYIQAALHHDTEIPPLKPEKLQDGLRDLPEPELL